MASSEKNVNRVAFDAAEREAKGEPVVVEFGGRGYVLPPEVPLEVLATLDGFDDQLAGTKVASSLLAICRILLSDEDYEYFRAQKPSLNAAMEFLVGRPVKDDDPDSPRVGGVLQAYGFGTMGESSAPDESSVTTSGPVKLTSRASTG